VAEQARALGFDLCGVASAADFPELKHLEEWLGRGYAGEMRYLHDPRRQSPAAAMAGARSIVACAVNYNSPLPFSTEAVGAQHAAPLQPETGPRGWISRYAWGDDYHDVLGKMLELLVVRMREKFGESCQARAYVDTGPVVERVAARHAGLGWLAKNTCLINEQFGSLMFLGVILTTLELAPSLAPGELPPADLCGNCTLCIEACPTGAIVEPYVLDARRCISYLTIELRGPIPEEFRAPMGRMVFGCDICQDVCPWNRKAATTEKVSFLPRIIETRDSKLETRDSEAERREPLLATRHSPLITVSLERLASLSEEEFREVFRGSAVKRAKWRGLVRNACIALGNTTADLSPKARAGVAALLVRLAASPDDLIADAARWALQRIT
jgi:epoxyqueuosine reductase